MKLKETFKIRIWLRHLTTELMLMKSNLVQYPVKRHLQCFKCEYRKTIEVSEKFTIFKTMQRTVWSIPLIGKFVIIIFSKGTTRTQNSFVCIVITCKNIFGIIFFNLSKTIYVKGNKVQTTTWCGGC